MTTPALVEASEIASRLASPDEPASLTIARREVLAHIVDLERNNEPAPEVGIKRQVRARAWFATLPHEHPSHTDILAIDLTPALSRDPSVDADHAGRQGRAAARTAVLLAAHFAVCEAGRPEEAT